MHRMLVCLGVLSLFLGGMSAALQAEEASRPAIFTQMKARAIGPAVMSGRITDIAGLPDNSKVFYVGTASGGLWKTINGGTTFLPVMDSQAMSIGCVAVDPRRTETIWVGTGECSVRNSVSVGRGLFRSQDGGRSWELKGLTDSERISGVIVHPQDSDLITVGVLGHLWNDHDERGVYRSADGGKTWNRLLWVNGRTGCADLATDPMDPNILYAAMWEFRRQPFSFASGGPGSGLFRSADGGKTWKRLGQGLPSGELGRIGIRVAPSKPEVVYALVESKETGLYRSEDRGLSWRKVNGGMAVRWRPFYYSTLEVDPKNPDKLYVCGTLFGVSTDGGKNFSSFSLSTGLASYHSDVHAFWIDPKDTQRVLMGTDGGVYASEDGTQSFRMLANLPVSQFYHVAIDMQTPYYVYGGLQDNGSWSGPSASSSGSIRNREWQSLGVGDGFYVLPHPKDPETLYYSWQGGKLVRLNRRTREAKDIRPGAARGQPKLRFNWNAGVSLSRFVPDRIYLGSQYLFRSDDRGESWDRMSPDLTTDDPAKQQQEKSGGLSRENSSAENHCSIIAISESPLSADEVWVGTDDGNLQATRDGGKSWANLTRNIPGLPPCTWCASVEAGHHASGTAYAIFDGHRTGDMKPYVFKTIDFGKTWQSLATPEIRGYCKVLREDPKNPRLLFLGSEFGLLASIDGGATWHECRDTLPPVAIEDMVIHPRDHDLVIATHGRGIYIVDDLTPFREIGPTVLEAEAAVLPSRPAWISVPVSYQEYPGNAEFVGENPASGAFISYYLKKRHIFGDLKLEILDPEGKVIKSLPASKGAGVNRIFWDMRYKAPKAAGSSGMIPMILEGPTVPEGTYRVRLQKGEQAYMGELVLVQDPRLAHSSEDRRLRSETVMKLFRLQESLAAVGDSTRSIISECLDRQQKLAAQKNEKELAAKLLSLASQMKALRASLVQEESMYGEEKLRERVMTLYSAVMTYGGRPTNSQQEQAAVLGAEITRVSRQFQILIQREFEPLNARLQVRGIAPITLPAFDDVLKKD